MINLAWYGGMLEIETLRRALKVGAFFYVCLTQKGFFWILMDDIEIFVCTYYTDVQVKVSCQFYNFRQTNIAF